MKTRIDWLIFGFYLALISFGLMAQEVEETMDLKIMQHGAWGLSEYEDPFLNKFPVVSYLPHGTILFSVEDSPEVLQNYGYRKVLSQYGHKLNIKVQTMLRGTNSKVDVYSPIKNLVNAPPTKSIIFHQPILCLGRANRIIYEPPYVCKKIGENVQSTKPVGKGWIYHFKKVSEEIDG